MPEPLKASWRNIKRWLLHYFYGLFATSWNGSISAVDAFMGLAVGAAVSPQVHAIDWRGCLAVFGTKYVQQAVAYFLKNPIPEKLSEPSEPPFPVVKPSGNFEKL